MMKHAWDGYSKYAWGKNEVRPVSLRGHTASIFGSASMGATIVDSLDTLYIMGMMDEFEKAREWVESDLDFNKMVCLSTYFILIFIFQKWIEIPCVHIKTYIYCFICTKYIAS